MLNYASYEDIIYIAIGIIWIAYSIYKGTQKNKAKAVKKRNTHQAEKKESKSVFESFFNDISSCWTRSSSSFIRSNASVNKRNEILSVAHKIAAVTLVISGVFVCSVFNIR